MDVDYNYYLKKDVWSIFEASYLLSGFDPNFNGTANDPDKKIKKIDDLLKASVSVGKLKHCCILGKYYNGNEYGYEPKIIIEWAISKQIELPEQLQKKTEERKSQIDSAHFNTKKAHTNNAPKPWKIHNTQDPKPAQEWYTAARYFARKIITEDPSLSTKRDLLTAKIVKDLDSVGIKKRGGKHSFNPGTIKKALSNVNLE